MMSQKFVPLPPAIIPFILDNLEGFDAVLEDGERIVITPKPNAEMRPASAKHLAVVIEEMHHVQHDGQPRKNRVVMRPKFNYKVTNPKHTPEEAKRFGLSKPRLAVYEIIHKAAGEGVGYADIREKSKLPHGSVMQILHWLRKQKLVIGTPESTS